MGERGKVRPVWKPEGTSLTFTWPMGMTRGERDYLTRKARQECGDEPARMIRWLVQNAWLYSGKKK